MKPKVILNKNITNANTDFNISFQADLVNVDADKLAKQYLECNVKETIDDKEPYVIIVCNIHGIDDSDRNFTPWWLL